MAALMPIRGIEPRYEGNALATNIGGLKDHVYVRSS